MQVHRFGSACLNRLLTYLRISLNGIKKCTISHSCHYACVACMGLENMHKQDSEGAEVFRPFSQKIGHGFASCASVQVHPKVTGREMVKELLTAYPAGILNVVNGIRILPREVAELIRNKSCPAVYFHPIKLHEASHFIISNSLTFLLRVVQ